MQADSLQTTQITVYEKSEMELLVGRTKNRLRTQVGHSKKVRRKPEPLQPVVAAEILQREGYSIDFTPESEEMKREGLETIWQYVAHRHPIDEYMRFIDLPSNRERWKSVSSHTGTIRQAFKSLRNHLDDDHRKYPLLMLPRRSSGKAIEVITFDPNYQINETQTSKDVYLACTSKRFKETTRSLIEKIDAIGGTGMVREAKAFIEQFIRDEIVNGCRQPMLTFEGDTASN